MRPEEAREIQSRAYDLRKSGDVRAALQTYRQAVAAYNNIGDTSREAHSLRHVADILTGLGELDEADTAYTHALELYEGIDAPDLDVANAFRAYAVLLERRGGAAEPYWRSALTRYEAAGIDVGAAECRNHLGY